MITLAITGHKSTETISSCTRRIGVASLGLGDDDHDCSVHRNSFLSFPVVFLLFSCFCFSLFYTVFFSHYSASGVCL
jgi:hypothetical protein